MSLAREALSLWRWWAPPLVLIAAVLVVLLVWLGVVDAPIRYEIL